MFKNLLQQTKTVSFGGLSFTLKKFPLYFQNFLYADVLHDEEGKKKKKYDSILEVSAKIIANGVQSWDLEDENGIAPITEQTATLIVNTQSELASFLLQEIETFNKSEDVKKN